MRFLLAFTAFFVLWTSPRPVAGVDVVVHGGQLRVVTIAADGLSGEIDADADRACLTIDYTLRTADGLTLRSSHAWTDECTKTFVPMVGT